MGMATPFRVTFEDGRTVEGKTLPIDYIITERQIGPGKQLEGELHAVMIALKRQGVEFTHVDDFLKALVDFEQLDTATAGNGAAPSGAQPSPPSPTAQESPQPS